jgi:hypothetical protein
MSRRAVESATLEVLVGALPLDDLARADRRGIILMVKGLEDEDHAKSQRRSREISLACPREFKGTELGYFWFD